MCSNALSSQRKNLRLKMTPSRGPSRIVFFIFVLFCALQCSLGQVLTPPYFNLAQGRPIVASATCGEDVPEPELYCKLVGANAEEDSIVIQGQGCDHCDPKKNDKKHPPEAAVDGRETWWQSPPLSRGMKYNEVNLTIELGQEFHVAYVIVKMGNSPRPGVWALERSNDNGQTYTPWQYFADTVGECVNYFGPNVSTTITADDSVICDTQYSKIVPLEGGEIVVPLVQNRPSATDFFNSSKLQEWTRATNVRFRLLRVKNLLGHLMSVARQDPTTTRRYFYSIKDISIGGRCRCNGHAQTCFSHDENDPLKLVCECKDNTCGHNCEICCPGFEQKKWSQSKTNKKFVCERCNCFGHSDQCKYNETVDQMQLSLDIHGNYEGGGVCENCQHYTEGINCNKCIHGYYRPNGKPLEDPDVCQPCRCDFTYSTGNCEDGTGKCECKPEYTKPNCDSCSFGYYGYPLCRACECYPNGTLTLQCNPDNGRCYCKNNYGGDLCRNCTEGYYNYPKCKTCDCNTVGSVSNVCNVENGDCNCKNSYGGRTCDQCSDGYYKFPSCFYCNCDVKGTLPGICDKTNGQCLCKPGYAGARCDQCLAGFTGFPDCKTCNCSTIGSAFSVCDITGKCTCLSSYAGKLCDQCAPGYYQYPKCLPCICSVVGTEGISCDDEGECRCKKNFTGQKCDMCQKGYYNFPTCEECNFNPAGVISTFAGCNTEIPLNLMYCKENVQGKICAECKDLYWNLQSYNPEGCEKCGCNRSGTTGRIGICDSKNGQCICKPSTSARKCDQCMDGWYNLTDSNLFGCTDCDCDVGGSSSNTCNKITGQCICLPRVSGRNCKEPIGLHYFPTLHQHQYEVEDGRTPTYTAVRYGFDESVFPGYSWKGYAVFSHLQNETVQPLVIDKPSVYRMLIRYLHFNPQSITGTISAVPEYSNSVDSEQKFQVTFKPTDTPAFVTVAGVLGNNPSPFVLNPGPWLIKIKMEKSIFLDYFVLMPAEYYEGNALVSNITTPCTLDQSELCRLYLYPNISSFDQIKGTAAYINDQDTRSPIREFYDELKNPLGIDKMPKLSNTQPELYLNLRISRPGPYVLVVNYATTSNQNTTTIQLQATTQNSGNKGVVIIYHCRYRTLCRQVVSDHDGKVVVLNFDSNNVNLILQGTGDGIGIDSVTAIPYDMWSLDYVQPKPSCIINDTKCVSSAYLLPPDSERFDFKTANENRISKTQPSTVLDNSTELVYLDENDSMIDISGKVPKPGSYSFIVHYYQPDHPDFDADIIIHNGQFYEAKLRNRHCPSVSGCRSLVKQQNGNSIFQLTENFVFTVKVPPRKGVWVQYVLLIPSSQYTPEIITEQPFDQTNQFISKCGQNHFYLDTSENGFCKEATFSITTKYNNGALNCHCDWDGSTSFECKKFGGQCPCRENVIGRRCDHCKTGHFGFPNCKSCNCSSTAVCDSTTGECICPQNVIGAKCNQCQPYTFGYDPIIGCEDCNCHVYGVENNDLQCDLFTGACKCKKNVEGRICDRCVAGNYRFPYCERCQCDLRGTTEEICSQTTAACFCKPNVQGGACDVCKDGTFNLQPDDVAGCTKCFCFGKTSRCTSSTLFLSTIHSYQNWKLATVNITKSVEISKLATPIEETNDSISVNMAYIINGIVYFAAPESYLGNKLTAYGGYLNYTIHYTGNSDGSAIASPDVILSGANMYLYYVSLEQPASGTYFPVGLKMVESNFVSPTYDQVTREDFMQVLQNLTAIYIKASYIDRGDVTKLLSVSFEVAIPEYSPGSGIALAVEQCNCPPNYKGFSCEECADGYYRVSAGLFGGNCIPCQCNGHASSCDKATGLCYDCKHNTKGDHCEKCEIGYYGNATVGAPNDCLICACPLPSQANNFANGCDINESGDRIVCDCIQGYTGDRCEKCAAGYYGNPDIPGEKCSPCECNGNINPSETDSCDPKTGKCLKCLNNTYGDMCEICAPNFYGDAVIAKDCQPCACDICGTKECNHRTGECTCYDNIVGEKCDRCADNHYGFTTCQGCYPCNCGVASSSLQCEELGFCRCQDGVIGRTCDKCDAGYWKYTPNGCTSCGCNIGYSIGVGCNVSTGLCECLPGVVGEKCDTCPYRSVLIPSEGCLTCDNCTHGLLDVTDEIRSDFQPIFSQFQTTAIGHYTAQRLKYINNTVNTLSPNISDVLSYQFDLNPYIERINTLEKDKETSLRKIQSIYSDVLSSANKGSLAIPEALNVESIINKVVDKSRMTVFEINTLYYNLETGAGPQIDYAIQEGKSILQRVQDFYIDDDKKQEAEEVEQRARQILSKVYEFRSPMNKTISNLEEVKKNAEALQNKLDELQNFTETAQKLAINASYSSQANRKDKLNEKINSLNDALKESNALLVDTSNLLKNTTDSLAQFGPSFTELAQNSTKLKAAKEKTAEDVQALSDGINAVRESVYKAKEHADDLDRQAAVLNSIIKNKVTTDHAVQAANSYKNIVDALEEAEKAANDAKKAIDSTSDKFQGFDVRVQTSNIKSHDLLDTARKLLEDVQQKLAPELTAALQTQNVASKIINETTEKAENLQKLVQKEKEASAQNKVKNLNADTVLANAENTKTNIKVLSENLPVKLSEAKELYNKLDDTKKSAHQTESHLTQIDTSDPEVGNRIAKLKNKPEELSKKEKNIEDLLNDLKQNVTITRDLASKIKVGVSLNPTTAVELPIPPTMLDQGSSNDLSLYVKTNEMNGLLLYVGNEATKRQKRETSKVRRVKTDDFLALQIENGYLVLTIDLGEKTVTSLTATKYIADKKWYKVELQRTGKTVTLNVTEEVSAIPTTYSTTGIIPGYSSVLNLDKDYSKFFIGGLPATFEAPTAIRKPTFSGDVEELTVDGAPIGLWNFVSISSNSPGAPKPSIGGAKERDVLLSTTTSNGCRFSGDGYVILKSRGVSLTEQSAISFRFKTTSLNGLLFLAFQDQTFISVELKQGFVFFQFNAGNGLKSFHTPTQYNDDRWHSVGAKRQHNKAGLTIDGVFAGGDDVDQRMGELQISEYMYVGGYPGDHKINDVIKDRFDGCIDNVQVNELTPNLNTDLNSHRIIPGCPDKFTRLVAFEEGSRKYVRWNKTDQKLSNEQFPIYLTIKLKTQARYGLIAYGTDNSVVFGLSLRDGGLVFKSGKQEVVSSANVKYNDDRWHSVMAIHGDTALHLIVDDFESFKSTEVPPRVQLTQPALFFGSVPSDVDASAAIEKPFVGLLSDATLNGVVINFDKSFDKDKEPFVEITTPSPVDVLGTTAPPPVEIQPPGNNVAPGVLPLIPAQDPDISKDNGFRFGTVKDSAMTFGFTQAQMQGKVEFSIDVKTVSTEGIIFYVTQPQRKDFIALYLKDSKVYFSFNCVTSAANISSEVQINEGEWHTISFSVNQNQGSLNIDNKETKVSSVGCKSFDIAAPYYIGGMDAPTLNIATTHLQGFNKSFVGCLNNFVVNGEKYETPTTSIGVIPCSSKVESGVFFPASGGYLKAFESFQVGRELDISFEIKPRNLDGILLGIHSKKQFLVVQMVDGSINFTLDQGRGIFSTIYTSASPTYFVDGKWHTVTAVKKKNIAVLTIDGKPSPLVMDPNGTKSMTTRNPLYIGGYPPELIKSAGIATTSQYVGCIKNLRLNENTYDLSSFTPHKNVMLNVCPTI